MSKKESVKGVLEGGVMSTEQAAKYLGINKNTLANMRVLGGGPDFIRAKRRCFYTVPLLEEWAAKYLQRSKVA